MYVKKIFEIDSSKKIHVMCKNVSKSLRNHADISTGSDTLSARYPRIEIRGRWFKFVWFVMSRCFYKYDVFCFRKYYQPGPDAELEFGFLRSQYAFIFWYKYHHTVSSRLERDNTVLPILPILFFKICSMSHTSSKKWR